MASINANFLKLKAGYLFPEIGRRVGAFTDSLSLSLSLSQEKTKLREK